MPENYESRYEQQNLENQPKVQTPETPAEPIQKTPEELKKEEIFEALQKLPLAETIKEKIGTQMGELLFKNIPDQAIPFLSYFQGFLNNSDDQKDFFKKGREVTSQTSHLSDKEKNKLWEQEWEHLQKNTISSLQNPETPLSIQLQRISRLVDQWRSSKIEHERIQFDEERVQAKRAAFEKAFAAYGVDWSILVAKQKVVGRLTFEVFLDDVLNKKFAIEALKNQNGKLTIDQLYDTWTQYAIKEVAKKNSKEFTALLLSSQENDRQSKLKAQEKILQLDQNIALSPEEKLLENQKIHTEREQQAAENSKMLNRQEIVISGLLGKEEFYWNDKSHLIYKIQAIGKYYYNTPEIKIDGLWGKQTSQITQQLLAEFEQYPSFPAEAKVRLQNLLEKRKQYENKWLKEKLKKNQIENSFDTIRNSELPSEKANKEEKNKKELTNLRTKSSEITIANTSESLLKEEDSSMNLSDEQLQLLIPKDEYLKKAEVFLKNHKNIKNISAESLLVWSAPEEIMKLRSSSTQMQDLLNWQRQWQNENLSKQVEESAIHAAEKFFAQYWILKNNELSKQTLNEGYLTFNDQHGKEFYYRPSSWKFSTQLFHVINQDKKEIDLSGQSRQSYKVLLEIPPFEDLVDMAKKNKSELINTQRPETAEHLQKQIKEKLNAQIHHSVGILEDNFIRQTIEEEQQRTHIMQGLEKIFNIRTGEDKILSKSEYPQYYQLLEPFTNSCGNANAHQLRQMASLIDKFQEMKKFAQTETRELPEESSSDDRKDLVDKLQPKTFDNLLKLLLQPKNIENLTQNTASQEENGLAQLIIWLSEWESGKASDYRKLDLKKIDFLLNPQMRNDAGNQAYRNSFQNLVGNISQKYLIKAGDQERRKQSLTAWELLQKEINILV